jgi:hypothetical protein
LVGGRREALEAYTLTEKYVMNDPPFGLFDEQRGSHKRARREFCIAGRIGQTCVSVQDSQFLNEHGILYQVPFALTCADVDMQTEVALEESPTEFFTRPAAVE